MNTKTDLPTFEDRKQMWKSIEFVQLQKEFPKTKTYTTELAKLYSNGKVEFFSFEMPTHPIWDWYASRHQFHELGFFQYFWENKGIKSLIPYELEDLNFFDREVFSFSSPFVLGGELAWTLAGGGAYEQFSAGGKEAKIIGEEAASELIDDHYEQVLVFGTGRPWSDFFYDVAWDHTHLVFDQKQRFIHVLLATDTD